MLISFKDTNYKSISFMRNITVPKPHVLFIKKISTENVYTYCNYRF